MKRALCILVGAAALAAWSSAMAQPKAEQPQPILSSAEVLRTVPYFTGNTILSPQPLTIGSFSSGAGRASVLSTPIVLAERPPQSPTSCPPCPAPPLTVQAPYTLSYVSPDVVRLQPLVPVQGGYSTFGYGPNPVAPAVGQVGPIYPEQRLILQSPLPYGYVGVSPLFAPGTVRVVP